MRRLMTVHARQMGAEQRVLAHIAGSSLPLDILQVSRRQGGRAQRPRLRFVGRHAVQRHIQLLRDRRHPGLHLYALPHSSQ